MDQENLNTPRSGEEPTENSFTTPRTEDKRKRYLWLSVVLVNIGTYLANVIFLLSEEVPFLRAFFLTGEMLFVLITSILISAIPVALAQSNSKWKGRIALGIEALILAPIPFIIWEAATCTGKMCGLVLVLAPPLALAAALFAVFYGIGIYFRKWSVKFALSFLGVFGLVIISELSFIGYVVYTDMSEKQISEKIFDENANPDNMVGACEKLNDMYNNNFAGDRYYEKTSLCWAKTSEKNPGKKICSLATSDTAKESCVFALGIHYRVSDNCEYDIEKNYAQAMKQVDDPVEYKKLVSCWKEKAKQYPEIDICEWSYGFNEVACVDFFNSLPPEERMASGKISVDDTRAIEEEE